MAGFLARPYYTGRVPAHVLAGAVLPEAHNESQVSERRYLSEGSMTLLDAKTTNPKRGSHTSPLTRSKWRSLTPRGGTRPVNAT
jgi:hypothetical protein